MAAARFRLTHSVESGGTAELPFVVGVIADLSGQGRLPPLNARSFTAFDRNSLDNLMADAGPRLTLRVPDRLTDSGDQFEVELRFEKLSDFYPAAVARQVPFLRKLIDLRKDLDVSDPQLVEIDKRLSRQLVAVLHHPEFRRLEGTWLGLAYLAAQVPGDVPVKLKVMNVNRAALAEDFTKADGFDQSDLFQKVYEQPYSDTSGEPFCLLISDLEFAHQPADEVALLRNLAGVAEFALAPLVAGASPKMLGLENFAGLSGVRDVSKIFDKAEYAPWRSFRDSEESRFVGLAMPHVLARPHYDPITHPVEDFDFDEGAVGTDPTQHLWTSAAWAFAGRVLAALGRDGWFMKCCGRDGGWVDDLPSLADYQGAKTRKQFTDGKLNEMTEVELSGRGFLTLSELTGEPMFLGAASCQKPKQFFDEKVTAHADKGAKLNYMLSLVRFAHLVKVLARSKYGAFDNAKACEKWLNDRLGEFVGNEPARPLREAKVEVKKAQGSPYHQAVLTLRPSYQTEDPEFFMRLGTEIPLRV